MKTISEVKKDMDFNKDLSSLIETLKTIAVSQYKTLEKKTKSFPELFQVVDSFFENLDINQIKHPFLVPQSKTQAVVAVTSDAGLLGGLNLQVVEASINELAKIPGKLIVIGERGKMYIRGRGIPSVSYPGIDDEHRFEQAMELRNYLVNKVLQGEFGYVKVIYPRAVSFTVQKVEMISFFPFIPSRIKETTSHDLDVIIESEPSDMIEYLLYLWCGQTLYDIFGFARLAEFSARYIHLEESAQKLKEEEKKVKQQYFRVKHELVDRTMRELFAGRALYAKK